MSDAQEGKLQQNRRRLEREQKQNAEVEQVQTKMQSKCLLEKAAEAILYQIFSLLTAREHWNLSTTSHKLKLISNHSQASPTQIDILPVTEPQVVKHLLKLRPLRLSIFSNVHGELSKMKQVHELTLTRNNEFPITDLEWVSQLTSLTKLKLPDAHFNALPLLPASLTHLHVSGITVTGFPYIGGMLSRLRDFHKLPALQVLKLPKNRFYNLDILDIGIVFPQLRELRFGYLGLGQVRLPSLTALQSCAHLESLSIGVDSDENIPQWDTLAPITSLRRLTVALFPRSATPSDLFAGLNKVTQLTYLKLVPHLSYRQIDLSPVLLGLTSSAQETIMDVPAPILPNLTSLLIDEFFQLPNAKCLSAFTSLTELQLPTSTSSFPDIRQLPFLRTLHTVGGFAIQHYKDQVEELVYNHFTILDDDASIMQTLPTMSKLKTLKLHPRCASPNNNSEPMANTFRKYLPPTARIEIDSSIEEELYNLG